MSSAIYQRPGENVAQTATITIETGTDPGDDNYGPDVLVDGNPAQVAKINSTTGAWLFDFGSAVQISLIALIHHCFAAGTDVKIQGNATNNWGTPSFEASITIPTWLGRTLSPWPVNPFRDLTGLSGLGAYRYWRLVITGNDQNLQLGQVWMATTIRTFDRNYKWSYSQTTQSPAIRNRTAFGVDTIYARGTHRYRFTADQLPTSAFAAELRTTWIEGNGFASSWLFIPNPTVNEAFFVRWSGDTLALQHIFPNIFSQRLDIEEVSRGLRPGI